MNLQRWGLRTLVWLALAMLVTWPASLSPASVLIGHPDVDVWNHAWGYWFIAHQLSDLSWPFSTSLIGVPQGGDLYFIDLLGAVIGAPLSWVFGPAVAYNGVMLARLTAAGLAGQALAEEVAGRGPHTMVAGAGMVTLPFLMSEMSNGISEVIAVHWIVWVLLAAWRAFHAPSRRAWVQVGILGGLATVASFYYGLVSAMMVAVLYGAMQGRRLASRLILGWHDKVWGMAAWVLVSLPSWLAFQWTLRSENALIVRPKAFSSGWILDHNAVDPRTYIAPGGFQSVDLTQYGEAFVHTAYLRWTVILLGLLALIRRPALRPWGVAAAVSLIMGLGPMLYWDGWVELFGRRVSLPFYWAQAVGPDVAITHPLRLSIGGQISMVLLASVGAATLARAAWVPALAAAIVFESLVVSSGPWPIPVSDAEVPEAYTQAAIDGPVLDLPGSVGKTMATSRYFWYQTVHGQPIPYTPNVRMDSCRDLDVQSAFTDPQLRRTAHTVVEHPARGPDLYQKALAKRYGAIVLHADLERRADLESAYLPVLTREFGPPAVDGPVMVWTLGDRP